MSSSDREPLADKGSWAPYMCPSCRGLFRAPTQQGGPASCPLCDSEIRLPSSKADSNEESKKALVEPVTLERRRRDRSEQSWEKKPSEKALKSNSSGIILTSLFLLSVAVAVAGFFLIKGRQGEKNLETATSKNSPTADKFKPLGGHSPASSSGSMSQASKPLLQLEDNDLDVACVATEKFLACQTIEEMKPLIREPERVFPLIEDYFRRQPFEATGALVIDEHGIAQVAKRFASFEVVLKNYKTKPIAIELTADGPLIDWESWVGYCEQPWEEFIENKSKEPTLVRVTASRAFYFNFGFRDDSKWACFRLSRSPDEQVIFGYVPTESPFLNSLPDAGDPDATFRLKIRFPNRPAVDNQVLITDFVGSGWVKGL